MRPYNNIAPVAGGWGGHVLFAAAEKFWLILFGGSE